MAKHEQRDRRPDIPKEIGPHEGLELELLLSGDKPLAMFSDIVPSGFEWPDAAFEPYVASGILVKKEYLTTLPDGHRVRHLFYAQPAEVWRIEEALALSLKPVAGGAEADDCSARLGRLLGYNEEEVQAFLRWTRKNRVESD
jgi:hypothetical protein